MRVYSSGQTASMWSFKVCCKAAYVAMRASTNLLGTSKHGLMFALSPYIPFVLASMGETDASYDKFSLCNKIDHPCLPWSFHSSIRSLNYCL